MYHGPEKITVRKLVVGSDGLDEKRREIIKVTTTLLGMVQGTNVKELEKRLDELAGTVRGFSSVQYKLWLEIRLHSQCILRVTPEGKASCIFTVNDLTALHVEPRRKETDYDICMSAVRDLHEQLPQFIGALWRLFPWLPDRCIHLLLEAKERGVDDFAP